MPAHQSEIEFISVAPCLETWLQERRGYLLRFFRRGMPSHIFDQAEDLYQEVCHSAFKAWPEYQHYSKPGFHAWLKRIATNKLRDWWKARRRALRRRVSEAIGGAGRTLDSLPGGDRTPSSCARAGEAVDLVGKALSGALDLVEREAIRLRYGDAQPWAAVAANLGRDQNSVKRLCRRALTKLAAHLRPDYAS